MKTQRRTGVKREPRNWQGGCRFAEETPDAELSGLLEDTLGHLRSNLLENHVMQDSMRVQRLELIGDIAARLQPHGRMK
ncbi:hypothetical protein BK796_22055 [Kosakonia pseudosacchari]|uniref:Uncharacterized protein n=1 Tax=Kosakonia pseudosacchari TaxID=1646340 RepID=A0ABX4IIN3_9ENTR|nr:hypothetical protein [Kosakonia pseudosacchari]PDO82768.1 hypothetical protein BK796_22055 [Kosakonia pseudosacchari]